MGRDLVVSVEIATPHFLEDEIFVAFTERSDACEHAIDDAAQGPEVGWRSADVVLEQFRANILRSSHESRFVLFLVFLDLVDALIAARVPQLIEALPDRLWKHGLVEKVGSSEVDHLKMHIVRNHDVFRLQSVRGVP